MLGGLKGLKIPPLPFGKGGEGEGEAGGGGGDGGERLPEGWAWARDPEGLPYFFHRGRGVVTYDDPRDDPREGSANDDDDEEEEEDEDEDEEGEAPVMPVESRGTASFS